MTLGERIKLLRKQHNLTQAAFGQRIGVTGATISTSESGKTTPDEQTIRAICSEFHISRDWLVDGIGDMKASPALIPELLTRLHKYPRVAEFLAAMTPEEWRVFNGMLERVFAEKEKKETD